MLYVTLGSGKVRAYPTAIAAISNQEQGAWLLFAPRNEDGTPNCVAWFGMDNVECIEAADPVAAIAAIPTANVTPFRPKEVPPEEPKELA